MIIQVRFQSAIQKFQIRVLSKPPRKLEGVIETVERERVVARVREIQESYRLKGLEVVVDSWNPLCWSVYVIHLKEEVKGEKKMSKQNTNGSPELGYLYVGMTGISVEERVSNHLRGYKSCSLVRKYFYGLFHEKIESGLSYEEATLREETLAEDLRLEGYWVYQK